MRSALEAIPTDEATLTAELGNSHMVWVNIGRALERLDWGETGLSIWRNWSAETARTSTRRACGRTGHRFGRIATTAKGASPTSRFSAMPVTSDGPTRRKMPRST